MSYRFLCVELVSTSFSHILCVEGLGTGLVNINVLGNYFRFEACKADMYPHNELNYLPLINYLRMVPITSRII